MTTFLWLNKDIFSCAVSKVYFPKMLYVRMFCVKEQMDILSLESRLAEIGYIANVSKRLRCSSECDLAGSMKGCKITKLFVWTQWIWDPVGRVVGSYAWGHGFKRVEGQIIVPLCGKITKIFLNYIAPDKMTKKSKVNPKKVLENSIIYHNLRATLSD